MRCSPASISPLNGVVKIFPMGLNISARVYPDSSSLRLKTNVVGPFVGFGKTTILFPSINGFWLGIVLPLSHCHSAVPRTTSILLNTITVCPWDVTVNFNATIAPTSLGKSKLQY